MLVVTIEKLETNRAMAYSGSLLSPYTVDPGAIVARVDRDPAHHLDHRYRAWRGTGSIRLTCSPAGSNCRSRPMLGCIGVAPARTEAISTAAPGAFGGNMDYASMGVGVKLMLPVNEPGALLFPGDGHARMGEGEVLGSGLETSMDVEFSVDLVKKKAIGWPRLETGTPVMARQRPPAARGISACDHGAPEVADGRLRNDRARRTDPERGRPPSTRSRTSSIRTSPSSRRSAKRCYRGADMRS